MPMKRPLRQSFFPVLLAFASLAGAGGTGAIGARSAAGAPAPAPAADPARDLHAIFDEAWAVALREDPLFATSIGDNRYDDRLPSLTAADRERRAAYANGILARLHGIDRTRLGRTDRVSYELFERDLEDTLTEERFKTWRMSITAEGGFHTDFSRQPAELPFASVRDYDNYIARLRAFPAFAQQNIAMLREGIATGFTQPRVVLAGFTAGIEMHIVEDVQRSVFWEPFKRFPAALPAAERQRLERAGEAAIREAVVPSYRAFLDFMTRDYIPHARTTISAADLPDGRAWYADRVRHFTTLELTPGEVHALGLREVERIHGEMMAVLHQVGFKGDLPAFLEFLRTDPRFYARTADELLKDAAWIAKRMDGKLPALFKTLPRQPYGIEPVPADLAPKYTGGRYNGAPEEGRRAPMYWVNTYALPSRPLYTLESLTLHESVPGHHLQGALAQELTGLPEFRRFTYIEAYGEGWGLYSEWLGLEAGFYTDPYSNFGRLTYEMWRACRLVVDTGLHAMGWSRDRVIAFMAANTALSHHEIETETDRYIAWPGQALAYKMGEMKIKALRREAEQALGQRFDVREFHDAVLQSGAVTLPILEQQVHDYIAQAKAAAAVPPTPPAAPAPNARTGGQ
jgi:uncharacterized protein (DUF885 family)